MIGEHTSPRDATLVKRPVALRLLDVAPEWVTLHEAAYAAKTPERTILGWAVDGRIEYVSLLGADDPAGMLVRTMDVRAMIFGFASPTRASDSSTSDRTRHEVATRPNRGMSRRKVLVALGAAVSGGLVPVHALAGKPPLTTGLGEGYPARAGGRRLLKVNCEVDGAEVDSARSATRVASSDAENMATSVAAGEATSVATGEETSKAPAGGGNGAGGRTLVIGSLTVAPDPVPSGGSATITVETSQKRKGLSYSLTASEGIVTQDPRHPWLWTWRDA